MERLSSDTSNSASTAGPAGGSLLPVVQSVSNLVDGSALSMADCSSNRPDEKIDRIIQVCTTTIDSRGGTCGLDALLACAAVC